jgi:hypothetical protein
MDLREPKIGARLTRRAAVLEFSEQRAGFPHIVGDYGVRIDREDLGRGSLQ